MSEAMTYKLPPMPFAVFDEFGKSCEDRVRDHFIAAIEAQGVPDGYALVSKGALQMVVNVLQRDAANGMRVRGEIVEQLLASAPPAPQAKPQPLSDDRDARIAELERELAELRKQMEAQKDEWLSWEAKRKALEKDAERWKMAVEIGKDVLRHPMNRKVLASVSAYMDAIHKGFDMTHAIDAAIEAAMKGTP